MPGHQLRLELEGKKPWSRPVIMEALSAKYGWTPDEIRNMAVEDISQYLEIIAEQHLLEKHRAMKNRK